MGLTAVLGASPQKERYSYLAFQTLSQKGLPFALVNPRYDRIDDVPVAASLAEVEGPIDTVTLYLAPERQADVAADIVAARPRRVIFNPGAENPPLRDSLTQAGIQCVEACTLVLLRTGQY